MDGVPAYRAIRPQTDPGAFGARHDNKAAQPDPVFVARLTTSTIVAADAADALLSNPLAAAGRPAGQSLCARHGFQVFGTEPRACKTASRQRDSVPTARLAPAHDAAPAHTTVAPPA